jgi:hypothetical protein
MPSDFGSRAGTQHNFLNGFGFVEGVRGNITRGLKPRARARASGKNRARGGALQGGRPCRAHIRDRDFCGVPPSSSVSLEYSNRASVTFRRRSQEFYLAKEALSQVVDCGIEKLDLRLLMIHFENWMEKYLTGKFVKLVKEDEYLFIRCVNRFMEDYKRVLWKKMKLLQYIDWDLKIDLTLDPKRFMRLEDELLFIGKAWAKLRAWLLKRYGRFEFLCVLEAQKSGRPHLHVLVSGIPYVSHSDLSELWQKYGGGYVWVRAINSNVNALWYVLKYVNKTILGKDKIYASILFASNKRMFSMSQNLLTKLNIRRNYKSKGWVFDGTVDEFNIKIFCQEEKMVFDDFIKVKITFLMMHKHPLIFDSWKDG